MFAFICLYDLNTGSASLIEHFDCVHLNEHKIKLDVTEVQIFPFKVWKSDRLVTADDLYHSACLVKRSVGGSRAPQ